MNLRSLSKTAVRRKKMDDPDGGDGVYSVECILKKRLKEGRTEYFVKWKGWAPKHNTWEPEENFLDAEVIHEFERNQKNRVESNTAPNKNDSLSDPKNNEFWELRNKLVDQILITDVSANDMTITVKECKTHQGFFKERNLLLIPTKNLNY